MRTSPLWTVAAADRVHHEPVPARAHENAATDGDVPIRVADSGPVRGQPRRVVEKGPGKEASCVRLRDGPRVPLRLRALDLAGEGSTQGVITTLRATVVADHRAIGRASQRRETLSSIRD